MARLPATAPGFFHPPGPCGPRAVTAGGMNEQRTGGCVVATFVTGRDEHGRDLGDVVLLPLRAGDNPAAVFGDALARRGNGRGSRASWRVMDAEGLPAGSVAAGLAQGGAPAATLRAAGN